MPKSRAAETQTVHAFERTINKSVGYKYLLSLPAGYSAKSRERWPLIFFLHGSGERGDDVWTVARHGPPKLLRGPRRDAAAALLSEKFIVVSPQCPKGKWWDSETLLALLDDVLANYEIDPRRVYLTGLSMGGFAAWDLGTAYPERFAALAPICGGGQFATTFVSHTHKRTDLRRLPIWAFHGAKDDSVPLAESERMVGLMKHFKVEDVRLTVYPEAKHDSWTETYANPELYAWFLRHERAK